MDDLDLGATIRGFSPGQKVFKRYTLKKILGRGGMGVVWLARDEELEREVALKFLPEVIMSDRGALEELKRETRRNLELTHPHIVRIYDFVQDERTAAISMEYVAGDTLSNLRVDEPGQHFEVEALRRWVSQLGEALVYAHEKGKVVHRDLKPANLMIDAAGDLKVTDFGIARSLSDSVSRVSLQAGSSGTPVYMSPQQMMGEKASVSDDIYALGATLYELLTGKPPFYSGNIILQVQNKAPPPLAERRAELETTGEAIPESWEGTIAACLAKEAQDRPQSVREVMERLEGTTLLRQAYGGQAKYTKDTKTESEVGAVVPNRPDSSKGSEDKRAGGGASPSGAAAPTPRKTRIPLYLSLIAGLCVLTSAGYYFGVHVPEQQRIAEEKAAEERRIAEEARLAEEHRQAEERRALALAQAEQDRVEQLLAQVRARVAELNAGFGAATRQEETAGRELADLLKQVRASDLPENEAVRGAAALRAQERYMTALRELLSNHPARLAKARVEELLAAKAADDAAKEVGAYGTALAELQVEIKELAEARVITGSLVIESNLAEAVWMYNDPLGVEQAGQGNVRLDNVGLGEVRVVFSAPPYQDITVVVQVVRDEPVLARAEFKPATVKVEVTPSQAKVEIEGAKPAGSGQWLLPPGDYVLRAQAEGFIPATQRITVKEGDVLTHRFALEEGRGPPLLAMAGKLLPQITDSSQFLTAAHDLLWTAYECGDANLARNVATDLIQRDLRYDNKELLYKLADIIFVLVVLNVDVSVRPLMAEYDHGLDATLERDALSAVHPALYVLAALKSVMGDDAGALALATKGIVLKRNGIYKGSDAQWKYVVYMNIALFLANWGIPDLARWWESQVAAISFKRADGQSRMLTNINFGCAEGLIRLGRTNEALQALQQGVRTKLANARARDSDIVKTIKEQVKYGLKPIEREPIAVARVDFHRSLAQARIHERNEVLDGIRTLIQSLENAGQIVEPKEAAIALAIRQLTEETTYMARASELVGKSEELLMKAVEAQPEDYAATVTALIQGWRLLNVFHMTDSQSKGIRVRIMGEVEQPGEYLWAGDEAVTLSNLIMRARGLTDLGDPRRITRRSATGQEERVDSQADNSRVILRNGDVVHVSERVF